MRYLPAFLLLLCPFLLLIAPPEGMAAPPQNGPDSQSVITLKVVTGEFRSLKGDLFIELADEKGEVLSAEIHPVTARTMTVRLDSLPPGPKAVRLFHDENSNGTLDTNFFGIPSEGYGFSNNPRSRFGEPSFADRLFEHQADTTIQVTLVHW